MRLIGLVGHQDDGPLHTAKALGNFFVKRHQACLYIDYQQDHVGRVKGKVDLAAHVLRQVINVFDSHSPGIDQFKVPILGFDQGSHPIACHTFDVIDDRQTPTGQPVEKAAFANVRATDDSHDG